jgi:hypothetical protein
LKKESNMKMRSWSRLVGILLLLLVSLPALAQSPEMAAEAGWTLDEGDVLTLLVALVGLVIALVRGGPRADAAVTERLAEMSTPQTLDKLQGAYDRAGAQVTKLVDTVTAFVQVIAPRTDMQADDEFARLLHNVRRGPGKDLAAIEADYVPGFEAQTATVPVSVTEDAVPRHTWNAATQTLAGVFAPYVVDNGSSGRARDRRVMSYIDKLAAARVFNGVVLFINASELAQKRLPQYIAAKGLAWWADTMFAIWKRGGVEGLQAYVRQAEALGVAGYVLDDANDEKRHPVAEVEQIISVIRGLSNKPIIATYQAVAPVRHRGVVVARQLYRQDAAADPAAKTNIAVATGVVSRWLKEHPCQVANLECFRSEDGMTTPAHLRDMAERIQAAGVNNVMPYAAVDAGGFKVWNYPELWDALLDVADDFFEEA